MVKCKCCGEEVRKIYDGKCAACLSVEAIEDEKKKLDAEHSLEGLPRSEPIDDIIEVFRFSQRS